MKKKIKEVVTEYKIEKRYSFEQYMHRKSVKRRHKGGMRAYIDNPNKLRTLSEWDKLFEGY